MSEVTITAVIPTKNASSVLSELLAALRHQTAVVSEIIVLDSGSSDDTVELAQHAGATVVAIRDGSFDHGATRGKGALIAKDADLLLYLTQDVEIRQLDLVERLSRTFQDPQIGVAHARQIPRAGSCLLDAHLRSFNYPPESRTFEPVDVKHVGLKSAFNSDACAMYRRTALEDIGGFPKQVICGEDMLVAAAMLMRGWKNAYCADAEVIHSHGYTWKKEARRYFDTGVMHHDNPWLEEAFGGAGGQGISYVKSQVFFMLRQHRPGMLLIACTRDVAKAVCFWLGKHYELLPESITKTLSLNKRYWSEAKAERGGSK